MQVLAQTMQCGVIVHVLAELEQARVVVSGSAPADECSAFAVGSATSSPSGDVLLPRLAGMLRDLRPPGITSSLNSTEMMSP